VLAEMSNQVEIDRLVEAALQDEMLVAVPEVVAAKDPLHLAEVKKTINGQTFTGKVCQIDQTVETNEYLYCIEYNDGEIEHLTEEEVRKIFVKSGSKKSRLAVEDEDGEEAAEDEEDDEEDEEEEVEAPAKKAKVYSRPAAAVKTSMKATTVKSAMKAAGKKTAMKASMKVMKVMKSAPMKAKQGKRVAMKRATKPMKVAMKSMKGKKSGKKGGKAKSKPKRR
jgi:hypothetical protein